MPSAQCRALNTSARQLQSEAKVRKAAAWTEAGALGHASASRGPHLAGGMRRLSYLLYTGGVKSVRPDVAGHVSETELLSLCTPLLSLHFEQVTRSQNSQLQECCLEWEAEPVRGLSGSLRLLGR